ncbi:YIP1 family protein [Salinarchaeum laminariae]|uniref:YIP1 family protein n=1 Tax=Salinarchaeum laminariae TaxID=869888 RepID=UPI0020C130F4|nr:YIP1 family protein [Salinarchaeum laminariae]
MTQWVEDVEGGRQRGLRGLALAWVEIIVRPRTFFEEGVAPGDQGPGLTFAIAVVLLSQATRFAVGTDGYTVLGGQPLLSGAFWLAAVAVLVAPVALHVTAALQTLLLAAGTDERGGVSETVQVLAYASAPCVAVGVPIPPMQVAVAAWACGLYVLGLSTVHELHPARAAVLGAVPAVVAYGYGFRAVGALRALLVGS